MAKKLLHGTAEPQCSGRQTGSPKARLSWKAKEANVVARLEQMRGPGSIDPGEFALKNLPVKKQQRTESLISCRRRHVCVESQMV